jgi:RNA polymerase sigma-70 factor (ECF subfamily)
MTTKPGTESWRGPCPRRRVALQQRATLDALREAIVAGRRAAVAATLHGAVEMIVDGGGRVPAPVTPVRGRDAAARALLEILHPDAHTSVLVASVNGAPALVVRRGTAVVAVVVVAFRGHRVATIWVVVNPDKLSHWNRP